MMSATIHVSPIGAATFGAAIAVGVDATTAGLFAAAAHIIIDYGKQLLGYRRNDRS